jgi:hypothetical protein
MPSLPLRRVDRKQWIAFRVPVNVVNIGNVAGQRRFLYPYFVLMLGTYKPRVYCLKMMCVDFLAEASLEADQKNVLFSALAQLISALPVAQRLHLRDMMRNNLEPTPTETATTEA